MIQCQDCEHFHEGPNGQVAFRCDPFRNIKEPECLMKWQILRQAEVSGNLQKLVQMQEATAAMHRRLAPLQEKMFQYMEREIDSVEDADSWKQGYDADDEDEDEDSI